jgi:hypothetical protein
MTPRRPSNCFRTPPKYCRPVSGYPAGTALAIMPEKPLMNRRLWFSPKPSPDRLPVFVFGAEGRLVAEDAV